MADKTKWIYNILLFILLLFIIKIEFNDATSTCQVKVKEVVYNLSSWTWMTVNGNQSFSINFCNTITPCSNSSICVEDIKTHKSTSAGSQTDDLSKLAVASSDNVGFTLKYTGSTLVCESNPSRKIESEVNVFCGKTLGNLEYVEKNDCIMSFEFYTTEACKKQITAKRQMPCYVYDKSYRKRDLSPLIKQKGAHRVWNSPSSDFYINVCRDITHDATDAAIKSPSNSSASINTKNVGGIVSYSTLELTDNENINLRYLSDDELCSTNITFVCPNSVDQIGGKGPVYMSGMNCHHEIIWETEYACPADDLISTSCKLSSKNVLFDLTPLQRPVGNYYNVTHITDKNQKYVFYMNVCSNMKNFPCTPNVDANKQSVGVCQTWGYNNGKITGDAHSMQLKYADRQLTMIYKHGSACSSGYHRNTIIYFHCQQNSTSSLPVFRNEDECNYYFDWYTVNACSHTRRTGSQCKASSTKGSLYDLTALIKSNDNWHATDSESPSSQIFINVCGDLASTNETRLCPNGSAVCLMDKGIATSLGVYKNPPTVSVDKSIQLKYEDGSPCTLDGRKKMSIITFRCRPGHTLSSPVLLRKSSDSCRYEFIWETAIACPLGIATRDFCLVSDPLSDFNFDLNPIAKFKSYYSVAVGKYEYQLSVCYGSNETKCGNHLVGGCQYDATAKTAFSIGDPDAHLMYFDGFINVTYRNGDQCHNKKKRETHITFLCDHEKDIGSPQFEKETGCGAYNFLWYTKYACLPKMVECSFHDPKTGYNYDLSRLNKPTPPFDWKTNDNPQFTINVCAPIYKRMPGCMPFSAVCKSERTSSSDYTFKNNLGAVSKGPHIVADGNIVIDYVGGDACPSGGNMSSQIKFICVKTGVGRPQFDKTQSNGCHYVFTWKTEYACPQNKKLNNKTTDSCQIKDPITGYVFNMMPLKRWGKPYYDVSAGARSFVVNVCGNINGSKCKIGNEDVGACEILADGSSIVTGINTMKMTQKGELLMLTYKNGARQPDGYEYETVITFECDQSKVIGEPIFEKQGTHTIYFTFKTSLACQSKPIECKLSNSNSDMYNLEPLARKGGYWTALNKYQDPAHHRYYINVCTPISKAPAACPVGAIGGCQVDWKPTGSNGHSMGHLQSNPNFYKDILSVRYLNGDICHQKFNRSLRIFFHCSPDEGSPIFQLETGDCEYIFNWMTPTACPLKQYSGSNCRVTDSQYNHMYDLSILKNSPATVTAADRTFYLSVCTPIVKPDGCGTSSGACVSSKGGTAKAIGTVNDKLIFFSNQLHLEYTIDDIKTVINFICSDTTSSVMFSSESNQGKQFEFEWHTKYACAPRSKVECGFIDGSNGDQYDFSPLSNSGMNWRGLIPQSSDLPNTKKTFINICRHLVRNDDVKGCALDADGCIVDDKSAISLGYLEKSPYKQGSSIYFDFSHGDSCPSNPAVKQRARIMMSPGETIGQPTLVSQSDCLYEFEWLSSVAQPIAMKAPMVYANCTAINPLTGYEFDLNHLRLDDDVIVNMDDKHDKKITINICGGLKPGSNSKCGSASGACITSTKNSTFILNAGNWDMHVKYDGVLYMEYQSDVTCPHCNCKYKTVITFVCALNDNDASQSSPQFVSKSNDCTYLFIWRTKHACEKEVQCTAFGDKTSYNLGSLLKVKDYYSVSGSGSSKYILNVCQNIHSVHSTDPHCPPGSAACLVKDGKAFNLGEVDGAPVVGLDGKVSIKYINGKCPADSSKSSSSIITFECGSKLQDGISFVSETSCEYHFRFKTNLVCNQDIIEQSDCKLIEKASNKVLIDLSSLSLETRDYTVPSKFSKSTLYYANICHSTSLTNSIPSCKGAGICKESGPISKHTYTNLGLVGKQILSQEESGVVRLRYIQTEKGTSNSSILLVCDELIVTGPLEVTSEPAIGEYTFKLPTSLVCPTAKPTCTTGDESNDRSLQLLHKENYWQFAGKGNVIYYVNICGGVVKDKCPKTAAVCRQDGNSKMEVLALVSKQSITAKGFGAVIKFGKGQVIDSCQARTESIVIINAVCDEENHRTVDFYTNNCTFVFRVGRKDFCSPKPVVDVKSVVHKGSSKAGLIVAILLVAVGFTIIGYFMVRNPSKRRAAVSCIGGVVSCRQCKQESSDAVYHHVEIEHSDDEELLSDLTGDNLDDDDDDGFINVNNDTIDELQGVSDDEELLRV